MVNECILKSIYMTRQQAIGWLKAIVYIGIYGGLLMPVMFIPVVIFPFVFSKLIFFQVLIGITFPAYLVLAWVDRQYRPRPTMLYLAIVAYFIAVGLSVVFSVDPLRSWWGNQERMNGLFTLLHLFAWLTMAVGLMKTWPQWRRLLNYQIILSVFMAVVALLQKPFPNLLMFPAGDRVGGLLDNPIYMGAYQIFNLFFIALLWMKGASRNAKIWYTVAVVVDVAAFIAAQSRGAMVGLAFGLIVFAIAYGIMAPTKKAKRIVFAGVFIIFASYGLLFSMRNTQFVQNSTLARFTSFSSTTRTRLIAWEIAWKGFLDRPLTGSGLDTFHILFNEKYNPESLRHGYYETWFDRSHNTIMDVISMTGLFGLVTFAAIFLSLFWSVIRAYRRGWIDPPIASILISLPCAYFVQNLFVFDHPAAFSMSFLLYALVITATTAKFNDKVETENIIVPEKTDLRQVPWMIFGVIQIVFLVLIWRTSVMPFRASMLSIKSNQIFSQGDYAQAFQLAKEAYAIKTPYLDEQTFLQSRNYIGIDRTKLQQLPFWKEWHDLIIAVSDQHLAEHPRNVNPRYIYARFTEAMLPLIPEDALITDAQYKESIKLSPKRQQLYYSYSRFLIDRGRPDEALDLLNQVVSFDTEIGESHWILGLHLLFDRKQLKEGAEELKKAVKVKYPYVLQQSQEAMALAIAYDNLGDKEGLKEVMALLPKLPQGQIGIYVEIARAMEKQGLIDERNRILGALANMDAGFKLRIAPIFDGTAATIDAALSKTENQPPVVAEPVTTTTGTTGSGPRK